MALDLAKNALLVNLRFMNAAFARLRPFPVRDATLATDGLHIRFDPATLARLYAAEPAELTRAYLHIVLHNVFLHLYPGPHVDVARWDAACDIVVERTISELDLPATRTARAERQRATLARIDAALPLATAETVYRYLQDEGLDDAELADLRAPFYMDDHEPWYRLAAAEEARKTNSEEGERDEGADAQDGAASAQSATRGTAMEMPSDADQAKPNHKSHQAVSQDDIVQKEAPEQVGRSIDDRFADTVNLDRSKEQWKSAAYEMGVQLDAYAKLWGVEGANLAMNLRAVTREKQDYREFLRKFARMGEQIRVDGLVRRFIEKTYAILSQETSFFADMNVLIVQCDAAITDVARISNLRDLDDYLDGLEIKGLGGTDFRPVFAYVDDAVERGDLVNLGGLIYFTDGQGTYPARKPDYDTAFVFVDDASAAASPNVPAWAMKVELDETVVLEEMS